MKRTFAIFLALSLLANIALAAMLVRTRSANGATAAANNTSARLPLTNDVTAAINSAQDDTGDLLARLKAAGIPDKTARYLAAALKFQKYSDQLAELSPPQPYWRSRFTSRADETPETRLKRQQITRSLQDAMTDLFAESPNHFAAQRYAYLTPERREELRRLEKDYDDLSAETMASSGRFQLQSDTDNLKALAEERKREIDQFLTPEETAARDLRESPAARIIRSEYGSVIDNEDEYKNIHAIMQAAGDDATAQEAAREQIDTLLDPERMARIVQANDPDYRLAHAAAERLNLPPAETTAAITGIREQARQASAAIIDDNTLTRLQKKEAIESISAKSREQMDAILGAEDAETYAKRSSWMRALNNGSSFTIDSRGKFKQKR